MDWRNRRYFLVRYTYGYEKTIQMLKEIMGVRLHTPTANTMTMEKQPDESEKRGYYQFLISCPEVSVDDVHSVLTAFRCGFAELKNSKIS